MNLLDLPRAVIGGAFRVARIPVDLVFGRDSGDARTFSAEPPPEPNGQRSQQAEELRQAMNRAQEERKRSLD